MIGKSMIKPVAMILALALFAQQAYGDQLQNCISGAGEWRTYQDGLTMNIYEGNLANIQMEFAMLEAHAEQVALGLGVAFIVIVVAFTAVCAYMFAQTMGAAGSCFFLLAELIEIGGQVTAAVIVALMALAVVAKIRKLAEAEEYRDELYAYAMREHDDEVAQCNLQFGG